MLIKRVIPVLLIHNNYLVKTANFKNPTYLGDPINAIKIFNDKEVDEIVVLDIDATNNNSPPDFSFVKNLSEEAFMPFAYGGGITKTIHIEQLLNNGAEKVVINSKSFDYNFLKEAISLVGGQSIVVSIDVKKNILGKYIIYTEGGRKSVNVNLFEHIKKLEKLGVGEIFLTSINQEGTMKGYDIKLINEVSSILNIPVIAHGGAGKLSDFTKAINSGASAVAAGSLFVYHGPFKAVLITYPAVNELEKVLND